MYLPDHLVVRLAVALGAGLLIGIERERSHNKNQSNEAAGVRTFTLTALVGAISLQLGQELAFIAFALILGALIAVGYGRTRHRDPGMTTEVAQLATFLLGGLAMREPQLAAALGVVVAILLAARTRLHNWIHHILTDQEIRDGLLLAAAALVILPLTPQEAIDSWGVIKPRQLWALAVTVMAINGVGYIALRVLGPKIGLALAGFFSGFVSSTATIGAMGTRAKEQPELRHGAVAGAAVSSVATVVQLAVVIGLVSTALLLELALPLAAAGLMAAIYAGLFTVRSVRQRGESTAPAGRPFDPKTALVFVVVVGAALVATALLTQWLGTRGLLLASAVSGLGDAHASAISAASLAANGAATLDLAAMAVLAGFTTNALSKLIVAFSLGDRHYALALAPGIVLSVAASWAGLFGLRLFNGA
ncbi:MAG TPA: DUF4010 domain-containing protein [Povalibacter sp.]|nr:DUF4010 domain-containing protein [Povalibacter sp.]